MSDFDNCTIDTHINNALIEYANNGASTEFKVQCLQVMAHASMGEIPNDMEKADTFAIAFLAELAAAQETYPVEPRYPDNPNLGYTGF